MEDVDVRRIDHPYHRQQNQEEIRYSEFDNNNQAQNMNIASSLQLEEQSTSTADIRQQIENEISSQLLEVAANIDIDPVSILDEESANINRERTVPLTTTDDRGSTNTDGINAVQDSNVSEANYNPVETSDAAPDIPTTNDSTNSSVAVTVTTAAGSPAPGNKRRRYSTNTPTRSNADVEEDGSTCSVCLEQWDLIGDHRLVSLKCGHIFGERCIRRWLEESHRQSGVRSCPQCKANSQFRHIRPIYATRLTAVDRSEVTRLQEMLTDKQRKYELLHSEFCELKISLELAMRRIEVLESERLTQCMVTNSSSSGPQQNYKIFLDRNVEITKESGCRVMVYAEQQSSVIVSQKSNQGLFPGYGVRFIDVPSFRPVSFLHASARLIRDIGLSDDQQMMAVTSMEPRMKLFDLRSRQVAHQFAPSEKALWACAIDRNARDTFLYLGSQHGSTFAYDIRSPANYLSEFTAENDLSPVISISPVTASKTFTNGGILVCKLQSIWFHEYTSASSNDTISTRLALEGPFIAMSYEPILNSLLITTRNSICKPRSRYLFGKLDKVNDTPQFDLKASFAGSMVTPVMTRATQIPVNNGNTLIAGYIQDAKLLSILDVQNYRTVQTLPMSSVIYDTCCIQTGGNIFIAALTETQCKILKLIAFS